MWSGNRITGFTNGTIGDVDHCNLIEGQILTSSDPSVMLITVVSITPYDSIIGTIVAIATMTAVGLGTAVISSNIFIDREFFPTSYTNSNGVVSAGAMQVYNTTIYNVATPVGFDAQIGSIQQALSAITWIDTIFGRAVIQKRMLSDAEIKNRLAPATGVKGRAAYEVYYPQGRKLDQDIDLSFCDLYPSYCFFYVQDPIGLKPWEMTDPVVIAKQPFSFMFWCDQRKLDPSRTDNFSEELKTTILAVFNDLPFIKFNNAYEGYDNVLKDFTINGNLQQYCKYPYYALRIDAVCSYATFPENDNGAFDPNIYIDKSREFVTNSSPGAPNVN